MNEKKVETSLDDALSASFTASDPPAEASPSAAIPLDAESPSPPGMMLYRIIEARRTGTDLAALVGRMEHQWASPETGLIRMATSIPLAVLDYLIELEGPTPHGHVLLAMHIPRSNISMLNDYPADWDQQPCPNHVRDTGDSWATSRRSLVLRVPNAICRSESTVLLNPAHSDASSLDAFTMIAFRLDSRLRT